MSIISILWKRKLTYGELRDLPKVTELKEIELEIEPSSVCCRGRAPMCKVLHGATDRGALSGEGSSPASILT